MNTTAALTLACALVSGLLVAQEQKPVPKDSVRVSIRGCTKGYVFTAGRRTADQPGTADFPEGTHFRMNGPKKVMSDLKAREGSMVEITGLMKKDDYPSGINVGGVRIGPSSGGGSVTNTPRGGQVFIDIEGWRAIGGSCPKK